MFLISDGTTTGVSTTFPFPYARLPTVLIFELGRRRGSAPWLIALELAFSAFFLFLIVSDAAPTLITSFSIGFASLIICLKLWIQRKVAMVSSRAKIVGLAPRIIWIEHLTLCALLLLSTLWSNQLRGYGFFQLGIVSIAQLFAIGAALWPFCMAIRYAHDLPPQ